MNKPRTLADLLGTSGEEYELARIYANDAQQCGLREAFMAFKPSEACDKLKSSTGTIGVE